MSANFSYVRDNAIPLYKCLLAEDKLKRDVGVLEGVQRRAARMIKGLGKLSYEERLKRCQISPRLSQFYRLYFCSLCN